MKTTLNPFENAKRTAQGTGGGVSPAVIEEIQAQLEELAGAYSTTEHKTGRKWIDGKDIYEKAIAINETSLSNNTTVTVLNDVSHFSTIVSAGLVVKSSAEVGFDHATCYMNVVDNKLYMKSVGNWNNITDAKLIIEYTKAGA